MAGTLVRRWLAHPLTVGLGLDDPATTGFRREIISSKPFLKAIYDEWYRMLAAELPSGEGEVLELGSGAGYCEQYIPGLITSEIFYSPNARVGVDAQALPFRDDSLRAIVFTNVMHHIPNVRRLLGEALRCLRRGGKILMVEPWVSPWSRFVYRRLHHEPFHPEASDWSFPLRGPLSGANGALPWIVFERDREKFGLEFPGLAIERIQPFLPFRYLVSGGVSMRSMMPGSAHTTWVVLERMLQPCMNGLAMFAFVSVRKL